MVPNRTRDVRIRDETRDDAFADTVVYPWACSHALATALGTTLFPLFKKIREFRNRPPRGSLAVSPTARHGFVTSRLARLNLQITGPWLLGECLLTSMYYRRCIHTHSRLRGGAYVCMRVCARVRLLEQTPSDIKEETRRKLMICSVNICSAICSFSSRFLNRG